MPPNETVDEPEGIRHTRGRNPGHVVGEDARSRTDTCLGPDTSSPRQLQGLPEPGDEELLARPKGHFQVVMRWTFRPERGSTSLILEDV